MVALLATSALWLLIYLFPFSKEDQANHELHVKHLLGMI